MTTPIDTPIDLEAIRGRHDLVQRGVYRIDHGPSARAAHADRGALLEIAEAAVALLAHQPECSHGEDPDECREPATFYWAGPDRGEKSYGCDAHHPEEGGAIDVRECLRAPAIRAFAAALGRTS